MALKIRTTRPTQPPPPPVQDATTVKRLDELEAALNEISDRVDAILNALKEEFDLEIEEDEN